jgi:hypothetical protein
MPPPEFVTAFSPLPLARTLSVTHALRTWHRAHLLGATLLDFRIDGRPVDPGTLRLLNAWTAAQGAWNASRQEYFEAWRRLDAVLADRPGRGPRVSP